MTTQQKIQLAELSSQTLNQAEKIVTSQQRDQFRKALADGKGFGEALAAMDITSDQQTQLKTLFSSTQTQLISLLTPAQRQQILENMRSILQLAPTQSSTQSPTP
jgi:Spy/CpxP family protein refolding chaperone